jgi:hypothetical protein
MQHFTRFCAKIYTPAAITVALLLALSGFGIGRLHAQAATASIQGVVKDASGAAIPDAAVQVKNVATGVTQSTNSDAQGRYLVPDLGIGDYEIQATKMGFSTSVRRGITLTVGGQAVVDFAMQVGQQTQTVTVEGQASNVDVTNAAVGTLIGSTQMAELPLNGRSFEQLIYTAPGVSIVNTMAPNARQGRANAFSTAGARPQGYLLMMDDEAIDNFFRRGMGTITGSSLGMEGMAEFQILTNTYGAQFGGMGAVMNAVSKSGTNEIHGSAYLFERNSAMDARGFFDPSLNPFRRTQPGGSVGGPIKKDKMFFFFNYEGIWQLQGVSHIAFVPTASNRTPAASLLTTNPTEYNAIAAVMAVYPLPTFGINATAGTGEANVFGNTIAHENFILGRYDYTITEKDAILVRYFYDRQHVIDPYNGGNGTAAAGFLPYWPERDEGQNHFATLEWRRIISPTLINTARVSFSRPNTGDYEVNSIPGINLVYPGLGHPDPEISITGLSTLGQNIFTPAVDIQNRFTEADDIVWTKGAHTLHLGGYVQRVDSNVFYPFRDGSVWTYSSGISQFLSGAAATSFTGTPASQAACIAVISVPCYTNRDYRELDLVPYFQDDWKVNHKLTLNLGIRYEFSTNANEIHNDLFAITNYVTNTAFVNVPNANASNPNLKNWDPRIGFAYDVFADHKTSLRGGFAITHDPIFVADYNPDYTAVPPWPGTTATGTAFFPTFPTNISFTPSAAPGWEYYMNRAPYLIQYNLNIQRELGQGTVLNVAYVGSHGVDMLTEQERNAAIPTINNGVYTWGTLNAAGTAIVQAPRPNSHFAGLAETEEGSSSRYNSLQVSVNRRLTHNLQFQVAYTWSHCTDDGSSPLGSISGGSTASTYENPFLRDPIDKGLCYFNAKSNFRANGVYTIPLRGNQLVEGWQVSGIVTQMTGLPFSIYSGVDDTGYNAAGSPRPNYVAGCQVQTGFVTEWYNPACFTLQAPGTLGNVGRDTIIGPGLAQLDLSLSKDTRIRKISENFHIQFRAEAYNIFNHPQFGQPGNAIASSLKAAPGTPTGVTIANPNAAAGIISSIATNSTGRQIQLGVKLIF